MAHYFEQEPTSTSCEKNIKVFINDTHFSFFTDNDVFSKKGLDFGTRTLLESLDIESLDGKILDFGCGYGPIGIFLASNNLDVDMIDINNRAIELSKKNSKINRVTTNVFQSNMYENVKEKYDYIISNPPIRVGNEILYKILIGAKEHLKNEGHLIFVINKNQGAKTVAKKLEEYYIVKVLNKNKGFFVIDCQNR
jgi:16S rRNA (guanine1207-N2)-methyltransferase